EREIVEQDRLSAVRERRFQLQERLHLDLDRDAGVERIGGIEGGAHTACRGDMVFLDEDAVVERKPLIRPATDAYGIFLSEPQPGQGFARVEDARARARDNIGV